MAYLPEFVPTVRLFLPVILRQSGLQGKSAICPTT
jgi:hypothetical protein